MQAGAGTTYILPIANRKHKHVELEDEEGDGDLAEGSEKARASIRKRRKANDGSRAAAATFEPMVSFNAMSLDDLDIDEDPTMPEPARRRQGTPHPEAEAITLHAPIQEISPPRASRKDAIMDRHDPSRPHVVFVDSLSDSDDDDNGASTANSTLSDADTDDPDTSPGQRKAKRAIKINSRLRQHLQRQEALKRGPVIQELFADGPLRYGGAGIEERGLVLYRPMSFGIVEEVEDSEDVNSTTPHGDDIDEGPLIEEYGTEGQIQEPDWPEEGMQDSMDID